MGKKGWMGCGVAWGRDVTRDFAFAYVGTKLGFNTAEGLHSSLNCASSFGTRSMGTVYSRHHLINRERTKT